MNIRLSYSAPLLLAGLVSAAIPCARAQAPIASGAALVSRLGLEEADKPMREMPGWRVPKKVIVAGDVPLAELRAAAPGVEFVVVRNTANSEVDVSDADAMLGGCTQELLTRARQVRWIQVLTAGVERCLAVPAVKERQLLVTNMQRTEGDIVSEHAIALTLALTRNLDNYMLNQHQGRWGSGADRGSMRSLNGKTLLVVGLGGIGTDIARRGHAMGMKVTATRASGRTGPAFVSYVGLSSELLALAKDADVVINAAPLTPETTGIFDAKFFAALKPSAYFVNVARGGSVVDNALMAALNEKRLAGAALDVTDPEPLPANHPLWRTPNLIITPHVASASDVVHDNQLAVLLENLRRYVAGDKMVSVVDLERGY